MRSLRPGHQHSEPVLCTELNMSDGMRKDWRDLCVTVANESDSTMLTSLVQELIEAIDEGERSWRHTIPPSGAVTAKLGVS